ncbi:hypothetical protein PCK2_000755 [Pneumocystis canis]|nr:hypothetical protein PCK2_000755 [Pneumocystis canis]
MPLYTGDHKSLLSYMGMPFQIFAKGSFFGPYTPLQQIKILENENTKSYMIGSTNSLFLQMKKKYADLVVNVDTGELDILQSSLKDALSLSFSDRKWIDDIIMFVVNSWNQSDTSRPKTMGFLGSEEHLRAQFEEYFLALAATVKYDNYLSKIKNVQNANISPLNIDENTIRHFGRTWVEQWKCSENYRLWNEYTNDKLFDIVEPKHPAVNRGFSLDLQHKITEQIQELRLNERAIVAKKTINKSLNHGSRKIFQAVESLINHIESYRAERRKKCEKIHHQPVSSISDFSSEFRERIDMELETKGFDEKEEYKKLFKIRDEVFMNMQAMLQLPGPGNFDPNMPYGYAPAKDYPLKLPKYPRVLSEMNVKHNYPTMPASCGMSIKDDKSRLERVLRARIERRKADSRILNDQGSSKKHIEPRLVSNPLHYRKNKESGDRIKSNTKGPSCDAMPSYPVVNKGAHFDPKHAQELSAHEFPVDHPENSKENPTTYCENRDESSTDFLFTSMAIPGLRVSANVYEENTEKSVSTSVTTQKAEEKGACYKKDLLNHSSVAKSPDVSLESKIVSHEFKACEKDTQNKTGSSSLEYRPRSPDSPLRLSPLISPKRVKNVTEYEKLTNSKSSSGPGQCPHMTSENMRNTDEKNLKERKRLDNYPEPANSFNLIEQHNHQPYTEMMPSRLMYWRHGASPYRQRTFASTWYDSRDYPGPFMPEEDPYVYYRDRLYGPPPPVPPESVKFRDYDPYYTSEFPSIRHSPSLSRIPPYPTHPSRFPHARLCPPSLPFHHYPYSKHLSSPYPPLPGPPPISLRYEDSMNYRPDSRYLYQLPRGSYEWDDIQGYYGPEFRSSIHSMGSISRYEAIPYEMPLQAEEMDLDTKHPSGQRENDWERTHWTRHR